MYWGESVLNSAAEADSDSVGVQSVEPKSTINKADAHSRKVWVGRQETPG